MTTQTALLIIMAVAFLGPPLALHGLLWLVKAIAGMSDYQLGTLIGGVLSPLTIAWGMWVAWAHSRKEAVQRAVKVEVSE